MFTFDSPHTLSAPNKTAFDSDELFICQPKAELSLRLSGPP